MIPCTSDGQAEIVDMANELYGVPRDPKFSSSTQRFAYSVSDAISEIQHDQGISGLSLTRSFLILYSDCCPSYLSDSDSIPLFALISPDCVR